MGKVKVLTARQAADLIKDGDTVTLSGFVANGIAEALNTAAEERFLETGHPKDLTLFWVAGTGNKDGSHADHYAHEGMVKKVIGGHFNFVPKICEMLSENKIEGYNVPQGAIAQMLRDNAARKVGTISHIRRSKKRRWTFKREDKRRYCKDHRTGRTGTVILSENSSGCGIHPRYICR